MAPCFSNRASASPNSAPALRRHPLSHRAGWEGDGHACADIDECALHIDGCDQICVNTQGSYHCACNRGYTLVRMLGSGGCAGMRPAPRPQLVTPACCDQMQAAGLAGRPAPCLKSTLPACWMRLASTGQAADLPQPGAHFPHCRALCQHPPLAFLPLPPQHGGQGAPGMCLPDSLASSRLPAWLIALLIVGTVVGVSGGRGSGR